MRDDLKGLQEKHIHPTKETDATYNIYFFCSNCLEWVLVNIPFGMTVDEALAQFDYSQVCCRKCGCKTIDVHKRKVF